MWASYGIGCAKYEVQRAGHAANISQAMCLIISLYRHVGGDLDPPNGFSWLVEFMEKLLPNGNIGYRATGPFLATNFPLFCRARRS